MRKLMLFSLPFAAGTALCQYLLPESWQAWAGAAALLLGLALPRMWKGRRRMAASICAFGLSAGILWSALWISAVLAPAREKTGLAETVTVELTDWPEATEYGARCLARVPGSGLPGRAVYYGGEELLDLAPGSRVTALIKYGDPQRLGGEESGYYLSRGVFLRLYGRGEPLSVDESGRDSLRWLPQRLAARLRQAVEESFSPEAAGLIGAMLTGERSGMGEESLLRLERSGLMHITAVSGLHCGFLIALAGLLLGRRQRLTALVGYPVLLLYMLMAGGTPSVVRACIMTGFLLFAPLLGREGDGPTALSAAALVILLVNPFAIGSVSFQLSFAAVAGLMIVTPRLSAALGGGKGAGAVRRLLSAGLSASMGASVFTAPLSAWYFGFLPLAGPLANLLVLWAVPLLFAGGLLVAVLCIPFPGLAPLAVIPEALARYVLWAAELVSELPGQGAYFANPLLWPWLLLTALAILMCWFSGGGGRTWMIAGVVSAVCFLAAGALPHLILQNDRMTVVAVDVGQGAATLLHSGGKTALVDCGSLGSLRGPGTAVADAMAVCRWPRLDYVVLTHYHADHAGGLEELLAQVEAEQLLLPQLADSDGQGTLQREVLDLAARQEIPVTYVEKAVELPLGSGGLTIFPPLTVGDTNEEGLTVLASAGEMDVLITGDMGRETETLLVERCPLPDIEVLLAGHHGSRNSSGEELLDKVCPEAAVISVGYNSYGHPAAETLERMAERGIDVYRTDRQGSVLIRVRK